MLARERAARVEAGVEDRLGELARLLRLALLGVVEDERVQVAVARVEDVADPQTVARESSSIRRRTSGRRVRGTTPSWT